MAVFATNNHTHSNAHVHHPTGLKGKMSKKGKGKENIVNVEPSTALPVDQFAWDEENEDQAWDWRFLTDSSSSKVPPLFSKDGSYFFSLVGTSVKIFSSSTGQVVSTLSVPHLKNGRVQSGRLTSAVINPHNAFQLITGALDGRLFIWDFLTATLLRTIEVGQPIHHISAHEKFRDSIVAAVSLPNKRSSDHDAVILRISLKSTLLGDSTPQISPIGKTRFPAGLCFSATGSWLVAAGGHTVYVAKTSSFEAGFTKYVSPERITCLSVHPLEEYFATGDEKGNIRLWYCLNNTAVNARGVEKRTQTTSLHWHAHAVSSIAFTPNGAYLLSGGEEAVLVIWQLHTGKKEFVPRVGSAISTVSVSRGGSAEEYLLGLTDATLSFVDSSSLRITRSYSQVKVDLATTRLWQDGPSTSKSNYYPLAVHPPSSSIILPSSHPSSLQIFSPTSLTLISEVEVSYSNRVSRRDEKPIEPSRITQTAVSVSGSWMSTVDIRDGEPGYNPEVFLKLWAWNRKESKWTLHTRIDQPHGMKSVVQLSFSPQKSSCQLFLSSCGEDGSIKIWKLQTKPDGDLWLPHYSTTFRSSSSISLSWSPDATIFAVSLGEHVIVCDPLTTALRQTLYFPECKAIVSLDFIGNRHLLVVGTTSLVLWDLVEHAVSWHHVSKLAIEAVVPHPWDNLFAVFYRSGANDSSELTKAHVFRTTSPKPRSFHIPFKVRNVVWYGFPAPLSGFGFVALTDDLRIARFGDEVVLKTVEASNATPQSSKSTLFHDIFAQSSSLGVSGLPFQENTRVHRPRSKNKGDVQDIFSNPAYLTPSIDNLFEPLLDSFLHHRPANRVVELEKQQEDDAEEETMDLNTEREVHNISRVIDVQMSMEQLTQLFRRSSMAASSLRPQPQGKTNRNTNGFSNHVSHAGSLHRSPSTEERDSPDAQQLSTNSSVQPSLLSNRKRKVSLV